MVYGSNSQPDLSEMIRFYGYGSYYSMMIQGRIAKGAHLAILTQKADSTFTLEEYVAINLTRINGRRKEDPRKALKNANWFVDKSSIDPSKRVSMR